MSDFAVTLIMTGIAMWGDEEGGLCLDHGETLWFEESMSSQFNHNGMEILLTGTADIASHRDRDGESQIVIDDWKTGQVSPASFHQLFQYAILALRKWQDADSIKVRLNWLREGWSDELEFTSAEIMKKLAAPIKDKPAFIADMLDALEEMGSEESKGMSLGDATLKDVKIDGDTAKGTIVKKGDKEEPIHFQKIDGGWLVELPMENTGPPTPMDTGPPVPMDDMGPPTPMDQMDPPMPDDDDDGE